MHVCYTLCIICTCRLIKNWQVVNSFLRKKRNVSAKQISEKYDFSNFIFVVLCKIYCGHHEACVDGVHCKITVYLPNTFGSYDDSNSLEFCVCALLPTGKWSYAKIAVKMFTLVFFAVYRSSTVKHLQTRNGLKSLTLFRQKRLQRRPSSKVCLY